YSTIRAAVLAVGGWHDPYRDTVLRLVEHLPGPAAGLIGPWSHQYPDRGLPPGPAIGFLQETLRWFDQHLKGKDTGIMAEPRLRSWISQSHPPATTYPELPGRWVGDPTWPSPHITPTSYPLPGAPVEVNSPMHTGLDAGRFFPFGNTADLPPDQRDEDAKSACFDFPVPKDGPIEILGRPRVRLRLRSHAPRGQAIARLCDVAPDGSSTLITRGALNLTARHGRDRTEPWPENTVEDVEFELNAIGHAFPPGHRIRLAVSSAYWPWIWPQPGSAGFTLHPDGSTLELPVRTPTTDTITFAEPEQSAPLGVVFPEPEQQRPERRIVRDVAAGTWRLEADPRYGGTRLYPDGLQYTEDALETYTIHEHDPLSAHTRSDWTIRLHRPDLGWDVTIRTRSEITADTDNFLTANEVTCQEGDKTVFHRTWNQRIPRTAG
ncbi:CocE/NonD family hydrolase, partial [Streptomyces sp. NPDC002537]